MDWDGTGEDNEVVFGSSCGLAVLCSVDNFREVCAWRDLKRVYFRTVTIGGGGGGMKAGGVAECQSVGGGVVSGVGIIGRLGMITVILQSNPVIKYNKNNVN